MPARVASADIALSQQSRRVEYTFTNAEAEAIRQHAERRARNLFRYFGWQGGTIHQLAESTGCTVDTLLYAELDWTDGSARGRLASEACDLASRLELAAHVKGSRSFWYGVAMSNPTEPAPLVVMGQGGAA